MVPKPVDDPEAEPAVEPWPVREKKVCQRAFLTGSLMTLLLIACLVLGRESASSAIDLAKLTAMNNGTAGTYGHSCSCMSMSMSFPCFVCYSTVAYPQN
jgi:hypothetical protein